MNQTPNITCTVCGETDFHLKEGYYYCNECGTKAEQVRAVEVERDEDFDTVRHRNTQKIKADKASARSELTSWECYNYILRGMVEELIAMGAKDELKPMVFQIWAAFLRNKEVAFFSRRHPDLPKLGIRFEKRDAAILYNHAEERRKKKREKKDNASSASGSRREWKANMRKFNQSQYESSVCNSQSMGSQSQLTSSLSSESAPSNRAIQLKFSSIARKQLKKKMPIKHLKIHESDCNQLLKCHNISVKTKELKFVDRTKELSLKLVYAILAIGLNLIGDDIQLTDLLRFISEGHISTNNLERFFPSNISEACKDTLKTYRLHYKYTEFLTEYLREQCAHLCKAIHINYLRTPDLFKLVKRYTTELCLPQDIYTFVERLMNLHKPKMTWCRRNHTPCYESRAMAYIIFTLKLIFGIDGRKEKQMSRSARRINAELATMNLPGYDELFVWDDWVEYIELRKVVLCNWNLAICKQFKQNPSREMYLQKLEERSKIEYKRSKDMIKKQANMGAVFQHFLNVDEREDKQADILHFTPSFTPCNNILKRLKQDPKIGATIPKILHADHSKRSLLPLVQPSNLKQTFAKCDKKLKVVRLACTSKQHFVGIFRNPLLYFGPPKPLKVNLTHDKKPWDAKIEADKPAETIFQTYLETYHKRSLHQMRKKELNLEAKAEESIDLKNAFTSNVGLNKSFDLLEKDDMGTIDVRLTAPRRNLETINIFAELSDDDEFLEEFMEQSQESVANVSETTTTKLKISNFDCWLLIGKASELSETQANELKCSLQLTFFWLLETCALTIGVDWRELYDQLLVIETFFTHVIEPLDDFKDRIIFQKQNKIKDINKMVRHFQDLW